MFAQRFLLFFVVFFLNMLIAHTQVWPKVINEPSIGAYAYWFIESYDNGFFIVGPQNNFTYSRIIKTDINGDLLWDKKIGNGQYVCILGSIDQTIDGGFVVTGQSNKYDIWGDPVIIKFSACGEMEWCTIVNTPGVGDYSKQVRSTIDSCYLMLTIYSDPDPLNHIQFYKFDKNGELIWRQNYPPDSLMFGEISQNLYVDSTFYLISATCYYPEPGQTGGYERPYYLKTDTDGNIIWRLIYGSVNGYHGFPFYQPLKSASGFFYDIGWHSNYCDTPALFKFSESGEESYYQDLYPSACPGGNSAMNFLDDTTLVAFVGGTVNGSLSCKWIKTDTLGIENQSVFYAYNWIIKTGFSVISFDNKIVSLSKIAQTIYLYKLNSNLEFDSIYTMPRVYDSLCPYPIVSDTIDPDCGLIVNIEDHDKNPEMFNLLIYPNPARNLLTVKIPRYLQKQSGPAGFQVTTVYHQWGTAILEVYDLKGMKKMEQTVKPGLQTIEIDVSRWDSGMYLFRLIYGGECVTNEKVLIE